VTGNLWQALNLPWRFKLAKYVELATRIAPTLSPKKGSRRIDFDMRPLSIWSLRASDVTVIRSWLGHASLDTTNHYVQANLDTKRKAPWRTSNHVRMCCGSPIRSSTSLDGCRCRPAPEPNCDGICVRVLPRRWDARPSAPLLFNRSRGCRCYTGVGLGEGIHKLFVAAGVHDSNGRRPRIHDLRRSYAIEALIRWYRAGADLHRR
jgi:hypothetical protein